MNIFNKGISRWFFLAMLSCYVTACKKNVEAVLPGDRQDTQVNYYAASDVLAESDLNVNITLMRSGIQYLQHQTAFRFEYDYDWHVYPRPYLYSDDSQISYARYTAQPYHFVFSGANTSLLDTLLDLKPEMFHCLYLADVLTAQDSAPLYRFLSVTEPREDTPEGKVGVRFINLSPETTSMQVALALANGSDKPFSNVSFLQASDYSYFDPKDGENGLLRFKLTDKDGTIVNTAVPTIIGRSYAVITQGFKTEQRRQVARSAGLGDSTIYVPVNLRAIVRRTY